MTQLASAEQLAQSIGLVAGSVGGTAPCRLRIRRPFLPGGRSRRGPCS
jgi:hypothetical protein